MEYPISSAPLEWYSLKDDYPEDNEECLWCKVPICEPPTVASMCQTDFNANDYTHFARLKNEHFPICVKCNEVPDACTCYIEDICGVCEQHLDDCECTDEDHKGTYH